MVVCSISFLGSIVITWALEQCPINKINEISSILEYMMNDLFQSMYWEATAAKAGGLEKNKEMIAKNGHWLF